MRPLHGVEIAVPEASLSAKTDDKGGFRIPDIPPGTYHVIARLIGYARYEAIIRFAPGETVERAIVLPRLVLDTVKVVGEANVPLSFLEHRATGLGYFLTRSDLEKHTGRQIATVLNQAPGIGIIRGRSGEAWAQSKRFTAPIRSLTRPPENEVKRQAGGPVWYPEQHEKARGMLPGCYPRVYLDRTLLNSERPAAPVDLSVYGAETLEAVEYFSGPAQTPPEYSTLDSACGVLVLHSRRSP